MLFGDQAALGKPVTLLCLLSRQRSSYGAVG